jgi:hypothetical protein
METRPYEAGGGAPLDELRGMERQRRDGVASSPLFGVLPIARVIPQDVHSVGDYASAATLLIAGLTAKGPAARATGIALGVADAATSFMTDYRLSGFKIIPIEVHQALDYVAGVTAMLAPLWFGKGRRRDRRASFLHILVGAAVVGVSLVTDYRASRGRTWPRVQRVLGAPA